jgi:hypothetical protein
MARENEVNTDDCALQKLRIKAINLKALAAISFE